MKVETGLHPRYCSNTAAVRRVGEVLLFEGLLRTKSGSGKREHTGEGRLEAKELYATVALRKTFESGGTARGEVQHPRGHADAHGLDGGHGSPLTTVPGREDQRTVTRVEPASVLK